MISFVLTIPLSLLPSQTTRIWRYALPTLKKKATGILIAVAAFLLIGYLFFTIEITSITYQLAKMERTLEERLVLFSTETARQARFGSLDPSLASPPSSLVKTDLVRYVSREAASLARVNPPGTNEGNVTE